MVKTQKNKATATKFNHFLLRDIVTSRAGSMHQGLQLSLLMIKVYIKKNNPFMKIMGFIAGCVIAQSNRGKGKRG
ncbi:MAG: hypothetical protein AB1327_06630 [Bacillota bacterium]